MLVAIRIAVLCGVLALLPQRAAAALIEPHLSIVPVSNTRIETPRETRLMLCKVLTTWRVLGIPFWPGRPGYALSEDCRGHDVLAAVTPSRIAAAQAAGLMPGGVPPVPSLRGAEMLACLWGWGMLGLLAAMLVKMQRTRRRVERFATLEL